MFAKYKFNHLLLVYITINNYDQQDAIYRHVAPYAYCSQCFCNQQVSLVETHCQPSLSGANS